MLWEQLSQCHDQSGAVLSCGTATACFPGHQLLRAKLFPLVFLLTDPPFTRPSLVWPPSRAALGSPQLCYSEGTLSKSDPRSVHEHTPLKAGNCIGVQAPPQAWWPRLAEQLQLLFSFRLPLCSCSIGTASSLGQEKCFPECLLSSQAPSRQGLESPGRQGAVISPSCPQPAGDGDLLSAREVLLECTSSELATHRAITSCAGPWLDQECRQQTVSSSLTK